MGEGGREGGSEVGRGRVKVRYKHKVKQCIMSQNCTYLHTKSVFENTTPISFSFSPIAKSSLLTCLGTFGANNRTLRV